MKNYGFIRVAAATPVVKVASPEANARAIVSIIDDATENGVSLLVFPELAVSGYTCGDLFGSEKLIEASEKAVEEIRDHTRGLDVTVVVGAPVRYHDKLYNCAVIIRGGLENPQFFKADINKIFEGRKLDVPLHPGDTVYIPKDSLSVWNVFIGKLMPTGAFINMLTTPFFWYKNWKN